MSKFYYIVKGATKGDNVGEFEADSQASALKGLKQAYQADDHGLTIEMITKTQHDNEAKRIHKIKLDEANRTEE